MDRELHRTCYLIGEESLLLECAETLLKSQFSILGIISPSYKVKQWASNHELTYFSSLTEAQTIVLTTPFDYLFSLVNAEIISTDIIQAAKKLAINYHDALLPKYAGVHATSWAILNNETVHGISWHLISELIDAGDIIKQVSIEIAADDTAFTLNTKCFEAAITSFSDLVLELANDSYSQTPQNLEERTYYAAHQKPEGNGLINWNEPAEKIATLCRALDLGDYNNRLSTSKFFLANQVFVIKEFEQLHTI